LYAQTLVINIRQAKKEDDDSGSESIGDVKLEVDDDENDALLAGSSSTWYVFLYYLNIIQYANLALVTM
jgi:hypothetical protein